MSMSRANSNPQRWEFCNMKTLCCMSCPTISEGWAPGQSFQTDIMPFGWANPHLLPVLLWFRPAAPPFPKCWGFEVPGCSLNHLLPFPLGLHHLLPPPSHSSLSFLSPFFLRSLPPFPPLMSSQSPSLRPADVLSSREKTQGETQKGVFRGMLNIHNSVYNPQL